MGRYPEALDQLGQGLAIVREVGHRLGEADALSQLGMVHAGQGRYKQALEYHERALAIARDDGVRVIEVQIRNAMGATRRVTASGGACPSTADDKRQRQGGYPLLAPFNL